MDDALLPLELVDAVFAAHRYTGLHMEARQLTRALRNSVPLPRWATETMRVLQRDVRDEVRVADGNMRDRVMPLADLLDFVRSALTRRSELRMRGEFVRAGLRRRQRAAPGRDRFTLAVHVDDHICILQVQYRGCTIGVFNAPGELHLTMNHITQDTPHWERWLLFVIAAMRMAPFRLPSNQVTDNDVVTLTISPATTPLALRNQAMQLVHRHYPRAQAGLA